MSWKDKIRDADCELCPLHEGAEHVCLMGAGKKSARIMIVGEAPGAREDAEHEAFVGKAGELLNELLKDAGLTRRDCYITNAAKCRPPDNRTPTKGEARTCAETYLVREIRTVSPDIILLLGNTALQAVIGKSGITKHRGSTWEKYGATVLATLHPAAALRNPYHLPAIRADFRKLGRIFGNDAIGPKSMATKTNVRIIRRSAQLRALRKVLFNADEIAFDLETYTFDNGVRLKGKKVCSGLQEWRDELSVISTIQFSWAPGETAVVPLHHEATPWKDPDTVLRYLKPALEQPDTKYIGHNGKFDCRWLAAKGVFVNLTFDTMLAAHLLDENRAKGLKPLSQILLDADAYDIGEDVKDSYHAPLKRLCVYAAKDAAYTLLLYHKFREELKEVPRTARIFKKLMMPASNMLTKVERRGTWVDPEKLDTNTQIAEENVDRIKDIMYRYVPEHKRPQLVPDGATKKLRKELAGINFNSPQQVADWLFGDLGLPILEETDKGHPSSKESVLLRLAHQHKAARALLKYRKWAKYCDTYLYPLDVKHRDKRSRIHPTFKLYGTVTGRLSCTDPNLQNIPRNPFLRGVVGAPPGWKLIEADYSQVELRIAAMLANDGALLRVFHEGRDPHMEMAIDLTGLPETEITKELRKQAKPVNFGYLYGMGWEKFRTYARDNYEVEFSETKAKESRDIFFRKWSKLRAWHDRQRRLVQRYGYVQSPIGRIRHLPDVRSGDKGVRAEAERQAINSPVQSFASDLMLMSALRLDNQLDPQRCFIVGSIHDALLFQVRDDVAAEHAELIRGVMETPPTKKWFGCDLTVPIQVDVNVVQHWGVTDA